MCDLFAYMCEFILLHFCGLALKCETHARENLHNDFRYENSFLPTAKAHIFLPFTFVDESFFLYILFFGLKTKI